MSESSTSRPCAKVEAEVDAHRQEIKHLQKFMWLLTGGIIVLGVLFPLFLKGKPGSPGEKGEDGISVPIGGVVAWPAPLPLADDEWHNVWRVCDGSAIRIAEVNEKLAGYLGDTYGTPDPGYVYLPDFQGYFLRGMAKDNTVDPDGGTRKLGNPQKDSITSHQHGQRSGGAPSVNSNGGGRIQSGALNHNANGTHTKPQNVTDNNNDGKSEARPKNMAVYWIIRVQ